MDTEKQIANIRSAIENKDIKKLAAIAHRLKSGAGNVGAVSMTKICQKMESLGNENDFESVCRLEPILITAYQLTKTALEAELPKKIPNAA